MNLDRRIRAVGNRRDVLEGAGEIVGRVLPQPRIGLEPLDPFLMLDHFHMRPGGPGFPEHPHRGFEILTLVRRGWAGHRDNLGNDARIGAGGLMRITAGKGIWHGESGGSDDGEAMEGLQFWVNLAKAQKAQDPSFQAAGDADLPRLEQDAGRARIKVLVGPGSPIRVQTPMLYLEAHVSAGGHFEADLPRGHQGFVYVIKGEARFGADAATAHAGQVAILGEGSALGVENAGAAELELVLAAGQPHGESVLWNGPFVD